MPSANIRRYSFGPKPSNYLSYDFVYGLPENEYMTIVMIRWSIGFKLNICVYLFDNQMHIPIFHRVLHCEIESYDRLINAFEKQNLVW